MWIRSRFRHGLPALLLALSFCLLPSLRGQMVETAESLYSKGLNYYLKRDFKEATFFWKRSLELDPSNDKAKEYMEKAYEKYNLMQTHFYYGLRGFNESNFTNAIPEFEETLFINPGHEKAKYYLTLCYQALSDAEKSQRVEEKDSKVALLLRKNEFRLAAEQLKTMVMLDPENDQFRLELAEVEEKLQVQDRAEELKLHLETARDFSRREKFIDAIAEWSKALEIDPANAEAKAGIDSDQASQREKEKRDKVNAFVSQGMEDFVNKRYAQSKSSFQKALQLDPKNKTSLDYIGQINTLLKAQADLQLAMDESDKHLFQGILLYTNNDPRKAMDEFNTALSLYDKNDKVPAWIEKTRLKIAELEAKERQAREEQVQKLLEEGVAYYGVAEYRSARLAFLKVQELDPANELAARYLKLIEEVLDLEAKSRVTVDSPYYRLYNRLFDQGDNEFKSGNLEIALELFDEILALFPLNQEANRAKLKITYRLNPEQFKTIIEDHVRQGRDLLAKTRVNEARDQFRLVKEVEPEYPGIDDLIASCVLKPRGDPEEIKKLFNEGILLFEQNKLAEAVAAWRKVTELDNSPDTNPWFAKAYLNITKAQKRLESGGQTVGASTAISASTPAASERDKAVKKHYYLGVAYYTQGDYRKAIAEWQLVLQQDPNNAQAINNIQKARARLGAQK